MMIIDDANLIDQVNPFLVQPPGTWSKPYEFSRDETDKEPQAMWEASEPSAACESSATGSDNQTQWCHQAEPNCPMRRALEPMQRVDPDIAYPEDPGMMPHMVGPPPVAPKSSNLLLIILLLLVVAGVLIAFVKF